MSVQQQRFTRVASLPEVVEGQPKAVRVKGHSVALFNVGGRIYATDNQCPHMGYPLTRGAIRGGVLTCDWHGWSFDLEGGGCFVGGCDDLATFPVDIRDGEIWLDLNKAESSRRDNRLQLLQEGLLTEDSWTLSKAIALLLADGLPEKEVIELFVKHMGRHIATHRGPEGGRNVAHLINGIKVARRYEADDRLIPLMLAANGASGPAGDRPAVEPLPPPVNWEKLESWVRAFSRERFADGIEKCLVTARALGGHDDRILPLLYECAVEPYFFGFTDNLLFLRNLVELVEELGWNQSSELVCNLSAKLLGRGRSAPERFQLEAMKMYEPIEAAMKDGQAPDRETTGRGRLRRRHVRAGPGKRQPRHDLPRTIGSPRRGSGPRSHHHDVGAGGRRPHGAHRRQPEPGLGRPHRGAQSGRVTAHGEAARGSTRHAQGALPCRLPSLRGSLAEYHDASADARLTRLQATRHSTLKIRIRMKMPGLRPSRTASNRCA